MSMNSAHYETITHTRLIAEQYRGGWVDFKFQSQCTQCDPQLFDVF